jgi:RNA polymerase-interacting CarD/CdnL/TRCF family regulator
LLSKTALQDFLKENNQKELSMHEQMMLRQAEASLRASELGAVYLGVSEHGYTPW